MKLVSLFNSNGASPSAPALSNSRSAEDIFFNEIRCAGTSFSTAATSPLIDNPSLAPGFTPYFKIVIFAHWVNASNFCLILPNQANSGIQDIEVFTDTANNIQAFLPSGNSFLDGTTSKLLNNSKGLHIRNTPFGWGVL